MASSPKCGSTFDKILSSDLTEAADKMKVSPLNLLQYLKCPETETIYKSKSMSHILFHVVKRFGKSHNLHFCCTLFLPTTYKVPHKTDNIIDDGSGCSYRRKESQCCHQFSEEAVLSNKQMTGIVIWRTRTCCAGKYSRARFQNARPTNYLTRKTAPAVPHSSCNAAFGVPQSPK